MQSKNNEMEIPKEVIARAKEGNYDRIDAFCIWRHTQVWQLRQSWLPRGKRGFPPLYIIDDKGNLRELDFNEMLEAWHVFVENGRQLETFEVE